MTAYDLGDVAVLTVSFEVAGVLTDPTAVTLSVRKPDGTVVAYVPPGIANPSVGVYTLQLVVDQVGSWAYEWAGTGAAADVETGTFYGLPDPTQQNGHDLCRLADVVARVPGYNVGDDEQIDAVLAGLITQESRDFVETTHREILAKNTVNPRVFEIDWIDVEDREVFIGDAAAVTGVVLQLQDGTVMQTLASEAWVEDPRPQEREDWEPITSLRFPTRVPNAALIAETMLVEVTGTWGFPKIPDTVRRAVATLVIFRYVSDVASAGTAFADAANQPEFDMAGALRVALNTRDRLKIPLTG